MAKTLNGITLLLRNDTAANWTASNPVLGKGEPGIESDTKKLKFGDGVTEWTELPYFSDFSSLTADDIPSLTLSKILDAGTAAAKDAGNAAGEVPVLNSEGKLDTSVIPALAILDTHVVETETEMTALDAQKGDVAVVTSESKTFILSGDDPAVLEDWIQILTPDCLITSVNGKVGIVVLSTDDIGEGTTNLYYTEDRATANFKKNIETTAVGDLSDGEHVVLDTDELILNCGGAEKT